MGIGTFAYLKWSTGIPTGEFLTHFAACIRNIGYKFGGSNAYGGGVYGASGTSFDDPAIGLPKGPPGLDAMGATVVDESGIHGFQLSLSSESGQAELFVGGKIRVVTLRMAGHMHPGYFRNDLEFILKQYGLLKRLHSELSPDLTWAIDYRQDTAEAGPGHESLSKSACWFSRQGPQKLIKPLEERRSPVRWEKKGDYDDFELNPVTGQPNWALVTGIPES
jgi:hypothetical protein